MKVTCACALVAVGGLKAAQAFAPPTALVTAAGKAPNSLRGASSSSSLRMAAPKKLSKPEGFVAPEPKPLSVTRLGDVPMLLSGGLSTVLRGATGVFVVGWKPNFGEAGEGEYALKVGPLSVKDTVADISAWKRPKKTLVMYDYEGSPFCRKVREAICMLDLDVEYKPAPPGADKARAELMKIAGKVQLPTLVDPNRKKSEQVLLESADIITYLFNEYGPGEASIPWIAKGKNSFSTDLSIAATAARGFAGGKLSPDADEANFTRKPLEVWGYEGSPFVRPVRETLTALGLPHKMVYAARGSQKRDLLVQETGRFQVPYLKDPNTGVALFESPEIVEYLNNVYSTKA